jgi:hypothetical protein
VSCSRPGCRSARPLRGRGARARRRSRRPGTAGLGARRGPARRPQRGCVGQGLAGDHRRHRQAVWLDHAVDDQQAGLDRGSVLGIGARREGQIAADDRALAPPAAQLRGILKQPRRHDGRRAAALGQGLQGRPQMRGQVLEGRIGEHRMEAAGRGQDVFQMNRASWARARDAGRDRPASAALMGRSH